MDSRAKRRDRLITVDSALNITFNDDSLVDLAKRAKPLGMAPEDLVAEMVARLLHQADIQMPPTQPGDYDGAYVELEGALDAFDAGLCRRPTGAIGMTTRPPPRPLPSAS